MFDPKISCCCPDVLVKGSPLSGPGGSPIPSHELSGCLPFKFCVSGGASPVSPPWCFPRIPTTAASSVMAYPVLRKRHPCSQGPSPINSFSTLKKCVRQLFLYPVYKTKAQRHSVTCLRLPSLEVAGPGFGLRWFPGTKPLTAVPTASQR